MGSIEEVGFDQGMDRATYDHSVDGAKWTFEYMRAHSGGPLECRLRCLNEVEFVGKNFHSLYTNNL
jgi:hypothetical protein